MPVKRGVPTSRQTPVSRGGGAPKPAAVSGRGRGRAAPVPVRGGRGGASKPATTAPGVTAGRGSTQKPNSDKQQVKKPQPTKEDLMATRIQTLVRAFLSR